MKQTRGTRALFCSAAVMLVLNLGRAAFQGQETPDPDAACFKAAAALVKTGDPCWLPLAADDLHSIQNPLRISGYAQLNDRVQRGLRQLPVAPIGASGRNACAAPN